MKLRKILCSLLAFAMIMSTACFAVSANEGTTYYVAVIGDDANIGTQDEPFASVQAAVNAAQDGDTVIVTEGNYNVFCPVGSANNYTGRAHNLFIGKNITVKGEGDVKLYSYQENYTSTFDARITVLFSGSDGAVLDGVKLYPAYYPETIATSLDTVSGSDINDIVGADTLKFYYNQIVDAMRNYNGSGKVSENYIANITIQNCTIGDEAIDPELWGSAIYYPGAVGSATNFVGLTGGYKILNNVLYGGICICEGASKDATSEECIISGNTLYDGVYFNGCRPTGWNYNSVTVFPQMSGNTFYNAIGNTDGKAWYISSRDGVEEAVLPLETLKSYIANNTFVTDGMAAKADVGSYAYSETATEYYALATPVPAVAKIGDTYYKTLAEAVNKAADGDVVYVYPGTYTDEIVVNKSIVLTGDPAYGADAALMAVTEKPVIKINNVTNGGVKYYTKNVVFDNLVFDVVENAVGETWNVSALGYYYENTAPKEGLTVTNCDFINNSDISMSAIAANISKYTVKNNTFKNFTTAVHSFVDHGAVDEVVISGNKFAGVENIASVYYGAPAAGNATIAITDNKSTDGSVAEIHLDDFGQTKATPATAYNKVTVSGNDGYLIMQNYGTSNFTLEESGNADDAVYSYRTEEILSRMANDVPQSNVYVQYGTDAQQAYVVNADGTIVTAEKVELVFVKNTDDPEALDNSVWDLVLRSADDELINRLNSADFTFSLTSTDDMDYEIVETNDEIEINNVNNLKDRYEFHFKNKNNVADTAKEITIGQVRFTGYGPFEFSVADETTNAVHATTLKDNIVVSYAVSSLIVNNADENTDEDKDVVGSIDSVVLVPTEDLTVNITFPNAVKFNHNEYQDMTLTVSGEDLPNDYVIHLGSETVFAIDGWVAPAEAEDTLENDIEYEVTESGYVIEFDDMLTRNTSYDITLEGAGYRTARYTVRMTDDKTVNFWNNVKDADAYMEVSKQGNKAAAKLNYLAGDIVKDNKINTYDLSAVVSYFGEEGLSENNNPTYAKYDLNRDGFIDSKDVAIVLVSWGN